MNEILQNWKTTSAGLVSIATGVGIYLADRTRFVEGFTAVLAGIGLVFARDHNNNTPAPTATT